MAKVGLTWMKDGRIKRRNYDTKLPQWRDVVRIETPQGVFYLRVTFPLPGQPPHFSGDSF